MSVTGADAAGEEEDSAEDRDGSCPVSVPGIGEGLCSGPEGMSCSEPEFKSQTD